jgi:hypothetical protein
MLKRPDGGNREKFKKIGSDTQEFGIPLEKRSKKSL